MGSGQQENIQFAQFIEQYPCLYDYTCKSYSNRHETDKAWQAVSDEFKIPVKQCKERWKNIRTVFRRHHFAKLEEDGSSRKVYYLTDTLQFLVPSLRHHPKMVVSSGLPEQDEYHDVVVEIGEGDNVLELTATPCNNIPSLPPVDSTTTSGATSGVAASCSKIERGAKRKADSSLDVDHSMINFYRSTKTDIDDLIEAQSDEHFLLSLKKDMQEMNPRQKRNFKKKIFDLIDDVLSNSPAVR